MFFVVVKWYAVRETEKWRYAVRKAKIGRYAVRKRGGGCHPQESTTLPGKTTPVGTEILQAKKALR